MPLERRNNMAKIIKNGVTFVESANITELPAKDITYNPSNGLTKLKKTWPKLNYKRLFL